MVLECGVVRHGSAGFLPASGGNRPAHSALEIELVKSLAEGNGRGDGTILRREASVGDAASQKRRDDVVSVLFIPGQKTILQEQGHVSKSVRSFDRDLIGRHAQDDFGSL